MRGAVRIRYYPRFPEAVPVRGAGCPRVTQPFATLYTPGGALTVRLACVRRAASVHPEPGSNSPFKTSGLEVRLSAWFRDASPCPAPNHADSDPISSKYEIDVSLSIHSLAVSSSISSIAVSGSQGSPRCGCAARGITIRTFGPDIRDNFALHIFCTCHHNEARPAHSETALRHPLYRDEQSLLCRGRHRACQVEQLACALLGGCLCNSSCSRRALCGA